MDVIRVETYEEMSRKAAEIVSEQVKSKPDCVLGLATGSTPLGIGRNGHIGFNEPGDFFPNGTHITDLDQSTIEANKRFFKPGETVPRQAFSMGIGTIMTAGKILLLASGKDKAWAVNQLLNGDITPRVPCSVLQFHSNVTVIADEEACWFL